MRRAVIAAFAVGFVLAFVLPALALVLVPFEVLHELLVPGRLLIPAPLLNAMAGWPGLVNLTIGGVANGLVWALAAGAIVLLVRRIRRTPSAG